VNSRAHPSRRSAIVAGVIVVLLAAVMGNLGLWQLRRSADVRAQNVAIVQRSTTPVALSSVSFEDPESVEFQQVTTRGFWRPDQEVLWRGRGRNSVTGKEVLTPLELVDGDGQRTGEALLVDRGWVPNTVEEPNQPDFGVPQDEVEVEGILRQSIGQPGFGPKDTAQGPQVAFFHADIPLIDTQVSADLLPMYLRLSSASPALDEAVLRPLAATEPDAGPHLGYALQWFAFALTGLVTYGAWLRKRSPR
jgi:surfeit locus 1 family protein